MPSGHLLSQKPIVLWSHDPGTYQNQDAVVNPDHFPNIQDGQLLRIHFSRQQQQQHTSTSTSSTAAISTSSSSSPDVETLIVKAACVDRETLARQQQLQVSISKDIIERFNLRFRPEVFIELVSPATVTLDHVELSFKEQYLGRSDMWRLQQSLKGTCLYVEKKILFAGVIKATVRRLFANEKEVTSGYIDDTTRMVFRSGSAKYFLFIQMSREMWEFDEDGELYYEKVVNNFLPQLFTRWKEEGTNHVVSIVLFTRVFYDADDPSDDLCMKTEDGRYYKDFYKVVADWETTDDWMTVTGSLKEEQLKFQQEVLTRTHQGRTIVSGRLAVAYEGNVLEAVNLALNPFDNHYVDRDLMRTGLSIILITPGAGKFAVNKKLLRLTNERMTDNGIAMDLVCLSPPPLHVTPLFVYVSSPPPEDVHENPLSRGIKFTGGGSSPDGKAANAADSGPKAVVDALYHDDDSTPTQVFYALPHWVDCSFYHHETGRFLKQDKFRTRCKMYDLQMMGIMEHDLAGISIPYLSERIPDQPKPHTLRNQKNNSNGSLNDRLSSSKTEDRSAFGNDDTYLSRSANFVSVLQQPNFISENVPINPIQHINYTEYDNLVFKNALESPFSRRSTAALPSKILTPTKQLQRSPFDTSDRAGAGDQWQSRHSSNANTLKSNTTWQHGDQHRVMPILSQSQQAGGKITFDSHIRKDDHHMRAQDGLKNPSPSRDETNTPRMWLTRRGTMNSNDVKLLGRGEMTDDDETVVVSSSTVDPMPINNKGISRPDSRKSANHSPRQAVISGSVPSLHKHSGNSDMMRTSYGGPARSSPSHTLNARNNVTKSNLINPCNPSDPTLIFTSNLRRWLHAMPRHDRHDGTVVHWRSLTTPACLPLTTDYCPSNEELKHYSHYMYTVSASEDVNLYQAGDRDLSDLKKTAILLTEMISQRLAQGFQIIVDPTGSPSYQKLLGKGSNLDGAIGPSSGFAGLANKENKDGLTSNSGGSGTGIGTAAGVGGMMATTKAIGWPDDSDQARWKHMVWWLSMGHQVHQLTFDSSGQNVEVRRYVQNRTFDTSKMTYKCAIWPKNMSSYGPKHVSFNYPSLMYGWNYLDHLVAGYEENLIDNLRFWRARFIVIPRETLPANEPLGISSDLDEEEKRLALFDVWFQSVRKAKWLSPEEREVMSQKRRKDYSVSSIGIKITTMDPSAYAASEVIKQHATGYNGEGSGQTQSTSGLLSSIGNLGQPLGLSKESKSKDIAMAMRDPKAGVKMQDRRWHLTVFRNSFIGNECVDWFMSQFDDINTREEAVAFGNALMERKPPLFVSSSRRHGFLDGHYFYQLHGEFAPVQQQQKPWFSINASMMGNRKGSASNLTKEKESNSNSSNSNGTSTTNASAAELRPTPNRTIEFDISRSMIIDVDPYKKSNRRETAILHYDTLHNANNCYHFQLNWLGCTAQLVQELVQNWSRQAERCGLKVVEGSVDQAYEDSENNNPFQCPVPIDLACKPPPIAELSAQYQVPDNFYEAALVRHLGYVLDVEADSKFDQAKAEGVQIKYSYIHLPYKYDQYIHRSGVAFVQIRPDQQGFYWVNNRLYTNHTPALVASRRRESSSLMHPELLRQSFQEFCSDPKRLSEFWETTRNNLLGGAQDQNEMQSWILENAHVPSEPTPISCTDSLPPPLPPQPAPSQPHVAEAQPTELTEDKTLTETATAAVSTTASSPLSVSSTSPHPTT